MMQIDILTLFPRMFASPLEESIVKKAQERKIVKINIHNIRDFAEDKHRQVDDTPFGGGAGMVLKIEPIYHAFQKLELKKVAKRILLSPQGKVLTQSEIKKLAQEPQLVLLCGRYEGIDERVKQLLITEEISIGDYVLSGGELPAMVLVEAIVRLLPGAIGKEESWQEDSFSRGIFDYPVFTRPREFKGLKVPPVLLSGDHQKIAIFRKKAALKKTYLTRPELIEKAQLSPEEEKILAEIKGEETQ